MNVAFLGLGKMGSAMARNLLRAGHSITAFNRTRSAAEPLAAEGATIAATPADAAANADAVFTMLADDAAVDHIVLAPDGIAASMPANAIHISSSTISIALVRRLAAEHARHGQAFLSAPVFGRPEAAASARLLVVAAGSPPHIDRCRPLFDAIGRQTFVAGPEPWQANALKLSGNFLLLSMLESFGEACAALRKAGVDPHLFLEVMNGLFASPVYANYGRMIADQQYGPAGFQLRLGLKDARLVLAMAEELGAPMPVASIVRDHLLSAVAFGQGDLDWSSLALIAARNAGL